MADQTAPPMLAEIAAARVLQWNVDFDRGLRSNKPGGQCEAVMKLGPQLVRWGHSCDVTASSANLFKLDPGHNRVFASAILLRLAETFRSGNSFVRVCILKVLMLEFKGRKWTGEGFLGENFEKTSIPKKRFPINPSHTRGRKRTMSECEGLFTKKRIENHREVLKKVKSVIDSGDPTSRALAIRVLGCLADLGSDSLDIHNIILQAVHSPHLQEVSAALFAMGCLSELSDDFAELALQTAFEMINGMTAPPRARVLAVRLFSKFSRSPLLSLQALEMGRKILLRYPAHEVVVAMLTSLSMLAGQSAVIVSGQVNLLLMYIAHDPRMQVRAVALKCLGKLIPQAFCFTNSAENIFNAVFAAVQDTGLPETLHELALRVIRKLCHQLVATMEVGDLLQIISWVELTALRENWPVKSQALALLVDMVSDLMKFRLESEPPPSKTVLVDLSARVCFLLCDQLAIVGADTRRSRKFALGEKGIQSGSISMNGRVMKSTEVKASTVCMLLVKFVKCNTSLGWHVVNSVANTMEAVAKEVPSSQVVGQEMESDHRSKSRPDTESEAMMVDQESEKGDTDRSVSVKLKRVIFREIEVLLRGLGRFLSSIVLCLEYETKTIENTYKRLHRLAYILFTTEFSSSTMCSVSEALMKAKLLLIAAIFTTDANGETVYTPKKLVDVNGTIDGCGRKLMQRGSFSTSYQLAEYGAICGFWNVAESVFDGLVDKVSSEGCYFWLKALSFQAKAERVLLHDSNVDNGQGLQRSLQADGLGTSSVDSENVVDGKERFPTRLSKSSRFYRPAALTNLFKSGGLRNAAAQAIHLLQAALSSLSAGVCPERVFDFQRRVLSLRLEFLETASELDGLLSHVNSLDTDVGQIDEGGEMNDDLKRMWSALTASTAKAQIIASRLNGLSKKYDSLSISCMGIDQESVRTLASASLLCSLLTFCSLVGLPILPTSSHSVVDPTVSVGGAAMDLYNRLYQFDHQGLDDLIFFAMQNDAGSSGKTIWGGTMQLGPQERILLHLCKSAVSSVLGLHTKDDLTGIMRGSSLLQEILETCLCLPWLAPPFFFCTRPRPGVELFVAQAGPSNGGEAEKLSVVQGSALALSICLQVVHASQKSLSACKRLVCSLCVRHAEITSRHDDDFQLGPESVSFAASDLLQPTMLERLMMHCEAPMSVYTVSGFGQSSTAIESTRYGFAKDMVPEVTFSVSVDSKGQGFGSCTLDVSKFPCGEYQLMLYCICEDKDRRQWILPLLSSQPSFWVT